MDLLGIILGVCLIFLLFVFVLFLYCAIVLSKKINELERNNNIKDQYLWLICAIGYDYDGGNTKKEYKCLIDELVIIASKGIALDDKTPMGIGSDNKKYNILGEEIDD